MKMRLCVEYQTTVILEILRRQRLPIAREVRLTCDNNSSGLEQPAADKTGINGRASTDGNIEARDDKFYEAVIQSQVDGTLRIARGECSNEWQHPFPAKRDRRGDPQDAARRGCVIGNAAF
jgi:hypothetical protein